MVSFSAAGYVCIDYYPDFNNRYYVTGNGVDVLFNLLQMRGEKKDVKSSIVSAISDDEWGKNFIKAFEERKIDTSHLEIIPGGQTPSVPLYLVNNDRHHGDPVRGIMANYEFSDETVDFIKQHDMMHSDFTGKLIPRLEEIHKSGTKVFFDLSTIHEHPLMETVLSNIDYGLTSYDGDLENAKAFLKYACSFGGPKVMVATRGVDGSVAYDGEKFYYGDIVPVEKVVNTVGAGDSFFAGFISAVIDGKNIEDCMASGAAQSSKVISVFDPYL